MNCRDLNFHKLLEFAGMLVEYLVKSFIICSQDNGIKL